eukprot:5803454-Pleurochrysis_carterae.AAC.2
MFADVTFGLLKLCKVTYTAGLQITVTIMPRQHITVMIPLGKGRGATVISDHHEPAQIRALPPSDPNT